MKQITKVQAEELTVKLHTYLKNTPKADKAAGVALEDALGKEDAEAYSQYLQNQAYQQHGYTPRVG